MCLYAVSTKAGRAIFPFSSLFYAEPSLSFPTSPLHSTCCLNMVKIIIIGAGISGLSSYLFLRKHLLLASPSLHDHEIKIYEAYDIHQSTFNGSSITVSSQDTDDPRPSDDTEPEFTPQAIGSAIGISKNGINVLSRLDNVEPKASWCPRPNYRPTDGSSRPPHRALATQLRPGLYPREHGPSTASI